MKDPNAHDKPETPHAPNAEHDVRIFTYVTRLNNGILVTGLCFRAICSCGGVSGACGTELEAIDAGFVHLDYQLTDHQ
jgi:hypothetical protein